MNWKYDEKTKNCVSKKYYLKQKIIEGNDDEK